MTGRLFHHPTRTTEGILNHYPASFQIYPSSNLILYHSPNCEQSRRQGFAPPQLTLNWRDLPNCIIPNLNIGWVNRKILEPPSLPNPTIFLPQFQLRPLQQLNQLLLQRLLPFKKGSTPNKVSHQNFRTKTVFSKKLNKPVDI